MRQTRLRYRLDLVGPLVLGTVSCLALWFAGAGQLGWLGFVIAALSWPAFVGAGGARTYERQWHGDDAGAAHGVGNPHVDASTADVLRVPDL